MRCHWAAYEWLHKPQIGRHMAFLGQFREIPQEPLLGGDVSKLNKQIEVISTGIL